MSQALSKGRPRSTRGGGRNLDREGASDKPCELARAIGRLVKLERVRRVVEVGCGSGRLALRLAEEVREGGTVLGLDIDRRALERSRQLVARAGSDNLEFSWGDAFDLPLEDGSVDLAVCSSLLCSVDRPEAVVGEMGRVVRPGGAVVVAEPAGPQLFHEPEDELFARLSAKLNAALGRGWKKRGADQQIGLRVPHIFLKQGLTELAAEGVSQVHLLSDHRRERENVLEQLQAEASPLPGPMVRMLNRGGMSNRELEQHRRRASERLSRYRSDPGWIRGSGYVRLMPPIVVTAGRRPDA